MEIKILKYIPDPYGDFRIGYAIADISGKVKLLLTVAKKDGKVFCTFPRIRVAGEWMNTYEMTLGVMHQITDAATAQVQSMIGTVQQPQLPDDDGDIPF